MNCLQVLVGSAEVSIFLAGETDRPYMKLCPSTSFVYVLQYLLLNLSVHQRRKVLQGTFLLAFLFVIFFFLSTVFSVLLLPYMCMIQGGVMVSSPVGITIHQSQELLGTQHHLVCILAQCR